MSSPRQESGNRPRSKSGLSFTSNGSRKTHRSGSSIGKMDLTETSKDKRHLNTKADPTLAMNEAQPSAIALEASNLAPLRDFQHKDAKGNVITDPDLSNPTRHRFERPLDTIRSFEEAIDGSYTRRASVFGRPDSRATNLTGDASRRNSYFNNMNTGSQGNPNSTGGTAGRGYHEGGYYGNRNSMNRPDSFIDQYGGPPPQFHPPGRGARPNPRNNSDPMLYGGRNQSGGVYPSHAHQQSYDTVTSGAGSHQTDPWGNSTDPSSENSSSDRIQQFPKQHEQQQQQMNETYGLNGFGSNQQYQLGEYNAGQQQSYARNGQGGPSGLSRFETTPESRPAPPPKTHASRTMIKLDSPTSSPLTKEITKESAGKEKRRSFFRRFSKG